MERLTEKIGNTNCVKGCGSNCKYGFQHCSKEDWENCKTIDDVIDKLAQYEELEEQGLLLRLPCPIGSTLYQPIYSRINEYKVIGLCFDISHNKWMYEVIYEVGFEWHKTVCDINYIGKTVFLTKSEAEAKLKELRGGENESSN